MQTFPHKKWNPFIQLDLHDGVFLTGPVPVPGKAWHIGAGVLAMPFIYLGSPKHNECKVFGDGMELVSRGHEPKYLIIPHLNLFPFTAGQPNILIPLLLLGSSNKCQFAVGSVVGKDGPIAVSIFKYVGINQACNSPCSMPTSLTVNWGTVILGFTWGDLVATVLCFAADSLISYIQGKVFSWLLGKLPKGLFKGQFLAMLRRFNLPKVFRGAGGRFASMSEKLAQETVSGVVGLVYGQLLGGGDAAKAAGIPTIDPFTHAGNGATQGAEAVGAWVDGRSETFPP